MYYVIVFNNTYDAMQGEKIMEGKQYKFTVMPTPTIITQSCGICLRLENEEVIEKVINEKFIKYKNIYIKKGLEFRKVD